MDRQGSLDADKEALERKVMVSIEQPFLTGYISRHFKTEILEGKALYYCLAPVKISWPIVQGHLDIQLTPQEDGTLHEADSDGRLERLQKLRQILDEDVIGVANGRVSAESSSSVSSSMPTRVLDLGTSEGDLDDNIRLLETTSFEPSEIVGFRWVALSHRWGTLPQFKTLKANLQKHYERIAFGALPKTFQDAVLVTRGLGLKYLWIDSLCIVQDDKDDWSREALRMGNIYRDSFSTIAAHTAADSAAGFLRSSLALPESVCLGGASGSPQDIAFYVTLPFDFVMDVDNSALSKRAWVLQERLLPTRIIHFTPSRIYIESSGTLGTVSEYGERIVSESTRSTRPALTGLCFPPKESPLNWLDIVERY
jgi:hypothetical protein